MSYWLKQLTWELRKLRLEVLEQRLEIQESNILQLERDLQQVRGEQQRLEEQELTRSRALAQLEDRLRKPEYTEDERAQLEASLSDLAAQKVDAVGRDTPVRRASAVSEQLVQERSRRQRLLERIQELALSLAESPTGEESTDGPRGEASQR